MKMELEQQTPNAAQSRWSVVSEPSDRSADSPDSGDLFEFLRDVSGFLARKDPPI